MYKDNINEPEKIKQVRKVLDSQLQDYIDDEYGANETVGAILGMLEEDYENLHEYQVKRIFKILNFLNSIQHLQSLIING